MRLLTLFFLMGYVAMLLAWMNKTPAFNGDLRVMAADGEMISPDTSSMYDRADYLFEIGYGYVFPDLNLFVDVENLELSLDTPPISFEEMQLWAQKGVNYLETSVALSPADANAWMALAWGRALVDDTAEGVFAALRQSWKFAPNNRILADQRLSLVASVLSDSPEAESMITEKDRAAIASDTAILMKFEPDTLNDIYEISPGVSVFDQAG